MYAISYDTRQPPLEPPAYFDNGQISEYQSVSVDLISSRDPRLNTETYPPPPHHHHRDETHKKLPYKPPCSVSRPALAVTTALSALTPSTHLNASLSTANIAPRPLRLAGNSQA